MRLLATTTRKAIVLGLAALGAYKAWELLKANSTRFGDQAGRVTNQVSNAVRQAEADVKDASHEAAGAVIDASRIAVAEVAEAVADAALGGSASAPLSSFAQNA